jgi:DNA-binding winged helix-turn-helix (wHTH) protein/tetratricopeptide (TPR) repeat protein
MSRRVYSFGPFQLDASEHVLLRDGRSLPLKPKVFDVLAVLVENSGRVVCKDELMKQVWADSFVEEGNLAVSIFEIRKVLGGGENGHRYIETVPRRGYRFVASVTEVGPPLTSPSRSVIPIGYQVPSKGSIAVLPFKFIGGTGDEYLGLGIADALITRLSNLKKVTVRPTSAIRKYNGKQDSVLAGKRLGVDWVLDGSVQKSRKRIRLTVQLVRVTDGDLMWADKFDERFTDILAVEDSISEQVAMALAPRLSGDEKRALAKRYTESPEAYEAYLQGRYFLEKRTTKGCTRGIEYFEKAVAIDPNYALAYAGIGGCYLVLGSYTVTARESYQKAESAILTALSLDDQLCEVHATLGHLRTRTWDWTGAEKELKRAIELNTNYALAHTWYALFHSITGKPDRAFEEIRVAQSIDPVSPIIQSANGTLYYFARQFDQAIKTLQRALDLDAGFALARSFLGFAYEAQGRYEEALREYLDASSVLGDIPEFVACVGRVHALAGRADQARQAIDDLRRESPKIPSNATLIALIHLALGDRNQALEWLERACDERDHDLCLIKVDPRLDSLRAEPRFLTLLERVGLAD